MTISITKLEALLHDGVMEVIDTIHGIQYLTNGSDEFNIVAYSPKHKLAEYTGFYEMEDFADYGGEMADYAFEVVDNKLVPHCESFYK